MIKLIAFDLDGTLLDDEKRPPEGFEKIIETLFDHHIRVVIASGRQYFNLKKLFPAVLDKLLFICENGGLIFDGDKNIFALEINQDSLKTPMAILNEIPQAATCCAVQNRLMSTGNLSI